MNAIEVKETEKLGAKVMCSLTKGSTAPLLVDRRSGKVRFDTADPRINLKARRRRGRRQDEDEFQRALRAED